VLLTNVTGAIGKAGKKGTLSRVLDAISKQTNPFTIVVRVPTAETEAEQRLMSSVR
jgi:phage tail sheath protein FI